MKAAFQFFVAHIFLKAVVVGTELDAGVLELLSRLGVCRQGCLETPLAQRLPIEILRLQVPLPELATVDSDFDDSSDGLIQWTVSKTITLNT